MEKLQMLNKIILHGRFATDVELKTLGSGTVVAEFTFASESGWGENKKSMFIKCSAWSKTGEFIDQHFSKGKEAIIEGELILEQWEKDGEKKSMHKLTISQIDFCGKKDD